MALSANSVFEIRTAGSDTNGGGFVTGAAGTDFSLQNAKNTVGNNISTTDAITAASTTLTSATAAFTSAIVGNIIFLSGGTGSLTAAWYQVTAFTNATTVTIDRNPGVSTGVTLNIGGALLSPGQASGIMTVAGMIAFILNIGADGGSTYSITSATANVSGGVFGSASAVQFQGYTSSRTLGNTDARPVLQLNVSTATIQSSASTILQNLILDGNSQTAAKAVNSAGILIGCLLKNFNTASTNGIFYRCGATTNSAAVFGGATAVSCEAYANTATPFTVTTCVDCISSNNTGGSTNGFSSALIINCIAVSNGQHGFVSASVTAVIVNCHAESNAGYGFNFTQGGRALINCSYFNNTSGGVFANTLKMSNVGAIPVTAGSVFITPGAGNFALNNTINQGALLHATADPHTFPQGLTVNYRDIGAAQHQDSPVPVVFIIDD